MIFVIDDDEVMAECIAKATGRQDVKIFDNAVAAMQAMDEIGVPEMILMEVLLTGPDGFTFLNEMVSYNDTSKVPIVLITGVDLRGTNLSDYGVVEVLDKGVFMPQDVRRLVTKYTGLTGVETGSKRR